MKIDNRIWIILTALLSVGVLAGAWFLGAAPLLDSANRDLTQSKVVDGQNSASAAEIQSLKSAEPKLDSLKTKLDSLRESVPNGVDGSQFIADVNSMAASAGVAVKNIALKDPIAYTPVVPATAAPATSGSGASASPSASPSASASATPTAAPEPVGPPAPAVPSDPLITSANFIVVGITVEVTGSNDQVLAFLRGLQHGPRLALVTGISTTTGDDGTVTLKAEGDIYVLKDATTTPATGASTSDG